MLAQQERMEIAALLTLTESVDNYRNQPEIRKFLPGIIAPTSIGTMKNLKSLDERRFQLEGFQI